MTQPHKHSFAPMSAPTFGERAVMNDPQQASGRVVEPVVLATIERPIPLAQLEAQAAAQAGQTLPTPVDPAEQAREIISEARTTARMMLQQARDVIASERAHALEEARAEGYAAGQAHADEETSSLIATCEQIGVQVMQERERVLAEREGELVELSIAIAERIVAASLDVDPALVVDACQGAMRKAFQRESMQILAHPEDLDRLRDAGPQLARELGGVEHLDFIAERRLDRGSVIVRTPAGEIDGTIAGKATKIEQALREGIEQRRATQRAA
jgi:flagellar biosynthesis/type III secretory pathway protein FliH